MDINLPQQCRLENEQALQSAQMPRMHTAYLKIRSESNFYLRKEELNLVFYFNEYICTSTQEKNV